MAAVDVGDLAAPSDLPAISEILPASLSSLDGLPSLDVEVPNSDALGDLAREAGAALLNLLA